MSESSVRIEQRRARPVCPRCESVETLPTLYGLPVFDWKVEQGKVAVKGCDMPCGDIPDWECQSCLLLF